jgi:penicillin amidase
LDVRAGRSGLRRRWPLRLLGIGLVSLAVVVLIVAVTHRIRSAVATRHAFPVIAGRIDVDGIDAGVAIRRDDRGVPHIQAASHPDAFFGLGFAHAQDRLGQMFWLLRLARGRSAEVVGAAGLATDRLARLVDFGGLADAEVERLDDWSRRALEAYARGVNARIQRIRDGLAHAPIGLPGGAAALEDWRPGDSLAVLKLYAFGLSASFDATLVLRDLIERLGGFGARRLFPSARSLDDGSGAGEKTAAPALPALDALRRASGLRGHAIGSSAWVIAAGETEGGAPLVVADAHLETTAPSLFYVAHFRAGGLDVAGATIPGIPVVWSGRNGQLAWASTNARAVTTDLRTETLRSRDASVYHDGSGWRDLEERVERIRVRGEDDAEFVVQSTHNGPLINGLLERQREPLSLTWTGARLRPRPGIASLLALARARDERQLRAALADHEEPPLVVVYAAASGAAGLQVAGWIPSRSLPSGLVPMEGRARWYDWRGRIPFDALPGRRLGDRGWAIAADNPLPSAGSDQAVEWLWRSGRRARRIESLLQAAADRGPLTLRQMVAVQADVGVERAPEFIRMALALLEDGEALGAEAEEVAAQLRAWDGRASAGSVGAAAHHVFLDRLTRLLLEPPLGAPLLERYLALPQADPDHVVFGIVKDAFRRERGDHWSEPARVAEAVRTSLRETWLALSFRLGSNRQKWHWGRLHPLEFRPLPPAVEAAGLAGLGPFPHGGAPTTVNAAEYDRENLFTTTVASTFRFAVDTATLDQVLFSLVPGQSGHPGHPHFDDGIGRWRDGRPQLLVTSPLLVEESSPALLRLEPRS